MAARTPPPREPAFLRPDDVATLLDVPVEAVEKLVTDGSLRTIRVGRYLRIARIDVDALLTAASTSRLRGAEPGAALAFYRAGLAVTDDAAVESWLRAWRIDPQAVRKLDLARALPVNAAGPAWARVSDRSWADAGFRLLIPLWDEDGDLQSIRAVWIDAPATGRRPKAVAPEGSDGLLLADMLALALLRPRCMPPEDREYARRAALTSGVVLAPDEVRFLLEAARLDPARPLVFGFLRESWASPLASRIPDGCRVSLVGSWSRPRLRQLSDALGERIEPRAAARS